MTDRKTTVHRSEHLRIDKFVSFFPMLVFIFELYVITLPLLFQFAKRNEQVMLPPYVLSFTSNPPCLVVIFSFAPHSNLPTPPPGNYFTVPIKFYEITAMKRFFLEPKKTNFRSLKFHSIR